MIVVLIFFCVVCVWSGVLFDVYVGGIGLVKILIYIVFLFIIVLIINWM